MTDCPVDGSMQGGSQLLLAPGIAPPSDESSPAHGQCEVPSGAGTATAAGSTCAGTRNHIESTAGATAVGLKGPSACECPPACLPTVLGPGTGAEAGVDPVTVRRPPDAGAETRSWGFSGEGSETRPVGFNLVPGASKEDRMECSSCGSLSKMIALDPVGTARGRPSGKIRVAAGVESLVLLQYSPKGAERLPFGGARLQDGDRLQVTVLDHRVLGGTAAALEEAKKRLHEDAFLVLFLSLPPLTKQTRCNRRERIQTLTDIARAVQKDVALLDEDLGLTLFTGTPADAIVFTDSPQFGEEIRTALRSPVDVVTQAFYLIRDYESRESTDPGVVWRQAECFGRALQFGESLSLILLGITRVQDKQSCLFRQMLDEVASKDSSIVSPYRNVLLITAGIPGGHEGKAHLTAGTIDCRLGILLAASGDNSELTLEMDLGSVARFRYARAEATAVPTTAPDGKIGAGRLKLPDHPPTVISTHTAGAGIKLPVQRQVKVDSNRWERITVGLLGAFAKAMDNEVQLRKERLRRQEETRVAAAARSEIEELNKAAAIERAQRRGKDPVRPLADHPRAALVPEGRSETSDAEEVPGRRKKPPTGRHAAALRRRKKRDLKQSTSSGSTQLVISTAPLEEMPSEPAPRGQLRKNKVSAPMETPETMARIAEAAELQLKLWNAALSKPVEATFAPRK